MRFRNSFRNKYFVVLLSVVSIFLGGIAVFFFRLLPFYGIVFSFMILLAATFHNKKKDSITGKLVVVTVLLMPIGTICGVIGYYSAYERIPLTVSDVLLYLASALLVVAVIMIKAKPKHYFVTMQMGIALLLIHEIAAFYPTFYALLGYGSATITGFLLFGSVFSSSCSVSSIIAFSVFLRKNVISEDKHEIERQVLISDIEEELIYLNSLWQNGNISAETYQREREVLLERISRHS